MKVEDILAADKNGEMLVIGDHVLKGNKEYVITNITWHVSGDGYYDETVLLECIDAETGKTKFFDDTEVSLKSR